MIARRFNAPAEGERLKLEAHATLQARRAVYIRRAQRALLKAGLLAGTATADDAHLAVALPEGIDPTCLGAAPGPLARLGIVKRSGYTPSTRPEAHARPVAVWELIDRGRAYQWLAAHPDTPDTAEADAGELFTTTTTNEKAGAATPAR
jgi:hypothetical protein